jgi:hypothetical protein
MHECKWSESETDNANKKWFRSIQTISHWGTQTAERLSTKNNWRNMQKDLISIDGRDKSKGISK